MPFYVPVGPRGLVFRFGTLLTGALGAFAYWRASRRRGLLVPVPAMVGPWESWLGDEAR